MTHYCLVGPFLSLRSLRYNWKVAISPNALPLGNLRVPGTCVIGLQWGDEAKGKIVDLLTLRHDIVVRYQGGANAGHTVVRADEVFKLHLVPSGVLYPHITSVIGSGVVVNPQTLIDELDDLTARGIDVSRVRVSAAAHVTT